MIVTFNFTERVVPMSIESRNVCAATSQFTMLEFCFRKLNLITNFSGKIRFISLDDNELNAENFVLKGMAQEHTFKVCVRSHLQHNLFICFLFSCRSI